ncbi:MAG TPA: tRNA (adenosine(37)-N6)-threonylcarbamoyltransferase complex ATPase subunit type 1 TsaE [Geobacteraceae bacterium]|nr:tRNA (adenosine(37)-N6)-threonylcarbamoyltransferase complex ATPase subunit type 1 TsaE [Geobacteraceae bacterium]
MVTLDSGTPAETEKIGALLGALLQPGDFIALRGELGAGKTRFARGVATGLGVDTGIPVTSPTYTLLNIYSGRLPLYHFDLYRLSGDEEVVDLGFADYFHGDGVSLVEWPERLCEELPPERLEIFFSYVEETVRSVELVPTSDRFKKVVDELLHVYKNG